MNNKLSAEEKELCTRIDEVLYYLWDPINVKDEPQVRDEYSSYVPHVFSLLVQNKPKELLDFLYKTEIETMGLADSPGLKNHLKKIVEVLEANREFMEDRKNL